MIHPASRLEIVVHSRADGRNAVKSAAYSARAVYCDTLSGERFRPGKVGGLLSHELINWSGGAERLWNAAEAAERRGNARVIRELRPSLPAELPLTEQVRLVRSFSLWLRDTYGTAIQADIHAPRFRKMNDERKHQAGCLGLERDEYVSALHDPEKTNLNFHAHILMTTRTVCSKTGTFGSKTRVLDDKKTGPAEVLRIRQEWQKRTNAALKRLGKTARVDLRSYETMAAAGDAPHGLVSQGHLGPRRAARSRRLEKEGRDTSEAGLRRSKTRERNNALWSSWLLLRAHDRDRLRGSSSSLIAAEREAERKRTAAKEKANIEASRSQSEEQYHIDEAAQFESIDPDLAYKRAMEWARGNGKHPPKAIDDEFSEDLDIETYIPPRQPPQPEPILEVRTVWVRGPRCR